MSFGDTFENDLLKLIFQAVAIANLADNAAASPNSNLYISLHTASPGEAGNQSTNECNYTSYARSTVARSSGGWAITGSTVSPVNDINFPTATGPSDNQTATYAAIGTALSGSGKILVYGPLNPTIVITQGVPPVLVQGSTIQLD